MPENVDPQTGEMKAPKNGKVDIDLAELVEADGESLQEALRQIANRVREIVLRRREISDYVYEDEGLKAEFTMLRTYAAAVEKMLEAAMKVG